MSEDNQSIAENIKQLENQIAGAEKAAKILAKWEKLESNREFKELIIDTFCGTEAARYVQASVSPSLNDRMKADALALAQASGYLLEFISVQKRMANEAIRSLQGWKDDLEYLHQMQREAEIEDDR